MKNDPALTYFRAEHYHRPWLLDCRVRKGNGYFQPGMGTGRRFGDAGPAKAGARHPVAPSVSRAIRGEGATPRRDEKM